MLYWISGGSKWVKLLKTAKLTALEGVFDVNVHPGSTPSEGMVALVKCDRGTPSTRVCTLRNRQLPFGEGVTNTVP